MITGTIVFIVELDVEVKNEEELNEFASASKKKIEEALPKASVEEGDSEIEEEEDEE